MRRTVILLVALGVLGGLAVLATPARSSASGCTDPRILVVKHLAQLTLVCAEGARTYPATFGAAPVGHKLKRGDERTPEGTYRISQMTRPERFHRFMRLSYPNEADRARARKAGVDPGGGIAIHGVRQKYAALARMFIRGAGKVSGQVWGPTDGCIGLINEDVEEVFRAARVGTEVTILP